MVSFIAFVSSVTRDWKTSPVCIGDVSILPSERSSWSRKTSQSILSLLKLGFTSGEAKTLSGLLHFFETICYSVGAPLGRSIASCASDAT